jgi:hypothetical protein
VSAVFHLITLETFTRLSETPVVLVYRGSTSVLERQPGEGDVETFTFTEDFIQ